MVWGVTPGDREAFVKAVNGSNGNLNSTLGFAVLMDFYGGGNLYNSLASFLEALHVGTMPESVELFYASGALGSIADIVTKAIDALVANPLDYLTDVLPDLAYTYGEVASSLQALLEQLGGLVSIELPSDFSGVVSMVGA